jgi:hypothetical protein
MSPDQPTRIRLSRSIVGEEEKKALAGVIEEGYLGMGRFVQEFEGALGEYLGVRGARTVPHLRCLLSGDNRSRGAAGRLRGAP